MVERKAIQSLQISVKFIRVFTGTVSRDSTLDNGVSVPIQGIAEVAIVGWRPVQGHAAFRLRACNSHAGVDFGCCGGHFGWAWFGAL